MNRIINHFVILHILLLYSVNDIAILSFLFDVCSAIIDLSFFNNINISNEIIFWTLFLDLGFSASTFLFSKNVSSHGHFVNSFAPFSDLSIYGLLEMITYFGERAQIQKCFDVSGLYSMRILFQTF